MSIPQAGVPREAEVVVVGAGLVGCSIAYQLAKRGRQVLVIDKRGVCSGASGRNGGLTGGGTGLLAGSGRAVYAMTSENLRMLRDELPRELGDDFSLLLPGTLDLATTEDELADLAASVEAQREHGAEVELLDERELRSLVPIISNRVLGAKISWGHGHLWPFQLVQSLADGARRFNARIVTHTAVTSIAGQNGSVQGIETAAGSISAGTVILATNAWTPRLLPDLPAGAVIPARGQILVTEPIAPALRFPFSTNFDKEYGRQTPAGHLVCGGYRRWDADEGLGHFEEQVTLPVLRGIGHCLTSLFPSFRGLSVIRAWSGIMGFTADGLPLIGEYGTLRGLYVAAGFNGGGFSWGAAVGKAVAQLICQGSPAFDLTPFDPGRFATGAVDWQNPFTAGERNNPRRVHARGG